MGWVQDNALDNEDAVQNTPIFEENGHVVIVTTLVDPVTQEDAWTDDTHGPLGAVLALFAEMRRRSI